MKPSFTQLRGFRALSLFVVTLFSLTLSAQVSSTFEGITTALNCGSVSCQYLDSDVTSHQLTEQNGIPVSLVGSGSTMGFSTFFSATGPNNGGGFSDGDYFGIAGNVQLQNELSVNAQEGAQAYLMEDVDGEVTVTFDPVFLNGTTAPQFSMYYILEETGWEIEDLVHIRIEMDMCGAANTVTLLNTSGQDIDNLGIEGPWTQLMADLSAFVECRATLLVTFSSNANPEELAIDNITFSEGSLLPPAGDICPTVGAVSGSSSMLCINEPFNLTATGLADLAQVDNNEQDFGVEFVAFNATSADPYVGGTSLGTVSFGSLTAGGTTAALVGTSIAQGGNYEVYAILSPAPSDPACRPSAMTTVTVAGEQPVITGDELQKIGGTMQDLEANISGGAWAFVNNADGLGTIDNVNANPALLTGTPGQSYTVEYSIDNGPCGMASDTVTVVFASETELSLGDIAFTGYMGDNPDAFSFVALVDINAGTTISFTEKGWLAAGGFRTGENTITLDFCNAYSCGTEFLVTFGVGTSVTDPDGEVAATTSGFVLALSISGDQVFAYQGTEPTAGNEDNFLAAIQMNGDWDADATNTNTSAQPQVFIDNPGTSLAIDPEIDNALFSCANLPTSFDDYLAAINDPTNWVVDGDGVTLPTGCDYSCGISITCAEVSDTVYVDADCTVALPDYTLTAMSDPGVTITQDSAAGSALMTDEAGTVEFVVTVTADNGAGDMASCTTTVVVRDTISPVAVCGGGEVVVSEGTVNAPADNAGACALDDVIFFQAQSYTADSDDDLVGIRLPVSTSNQDNTVEVGVTIIAGNTPNGTQVVLGQSTPVVIGDGPSIDLILDAPIAQTTGDEYTVIFNVSGRINIVCQNTALAGGTGWTGVNPTAWFALGNHFPMTTLVGGEAPPMVELGEDGMVTITEADIDGGSTDNCGIASAVVTPADLGCSEDPVEVTLTVTDFSGNTSSCMVEVEVEDTTPPVVTCMEFTNSFEGCPNFLGPNTPNFVWSPLPANGMLTTAVGGSFITTIDLSTCITDNCSDTEDIEVTLGRSFEENRMGDSVTLVNVLIFRDAAGNEATDSVYVRVTIKDTEAPDAVCQNVTVYLDNNGAASIIPADVDGGSSDNCMLEDLTISVDEFACTQVGVMTDTVVGANANGVLTVTDVNGNQDDCIYRVFVRDTISPVVTCLIDTVYLDANGLGGYATVELFEASDNCNVDFAPFDTAFPVDCSDVGTDITEMITVSDVNGNSAAPCEAIVRVLDTIAPALVCQDIIVNLDEFGNSTLDEPMLYDSLIVSETDACDFSGGAINGTFTPSCENIGDNTVGNISIDASDNTTECFVTVTVRDTFAPTLICLDTIVYLEADGQFDLDLSGLIASSGDNCAVTDTIGPVIILDCADVEQTPRLFDDAIGVLDASGNETRCSPTITVLDTLAPVFVQCPAGVEVFANDGCGYTGSVPTDGSSLFQVNDNCSTLMLSGTLTSEDGSMVLPVIDATVETDLIMLYGLFERTYPIGETVLDLNAVDASGLTANCMITITVSDTTRPELVCQDVAVFIDEMGEASVKDTTAAILTLSDNCTDSVDIDITLIAPVLSCDGATGTAILTATDTSGNVTTCMIGLEPVDILPPTAVCTDITVELDEDGMGSLASVDNTTSMLDGGSTDNCASEGLTFSEDITEFSCDDLGENTVTLTVTDASGLTATCEATVTVEDNIDPTVTVTADPVMINLTDAMPEMDITFDQFLTATDNCDDDLEFEADRPLTFGGADIGPGSFEVTVTDDSDNDVTVTINFVVTFDQPNLACRGDINVTLDDDCSVEIIPRMLFTGNVALLDFFSFEIVVQDDNPDNGPVIDGCGEFTYTVTATGTGDLELDFMTCWGTVTAEDKTPPAAVNEIDPIELLCVDLDENRVDVLPNTVDRCYEVFSATGATVPNTMATALRNALSANTIGNGPAVVPTFTDGCTERLEVCVSETVTFDAEDPQCNDVVITRSFTATEIAVCASASGETNPSTTSSYVITFTRPSLDDLDGDNIEVTAEYDRCTVNTSTSTTAEIIADYPAPRSGDFPFLLTEGGRRVDLINGQSVCGFGVSFSDSNPTITCDYGYKFVRTYTVLDWCAPGDIRTFTQVVKVGDTEAPTFTGPTQDRDFDGVVDGDLIYTTNAGNSCAAYIILDSPGVGAVDNCSDEVTITATIFPNGNFSAPSIGAFVVDPNDGNAEVTSPIPVGTHVLRYTFTDECGNFDTEDFEFTVEDGTAPVAICEDQLNVSISSGQAPGSSEPTGIAILTPEMIDAGSYDDCTGVTLLIALEGTDLDDYSDELILTCADLGTIQVSLRVEDENGNVNTCWLDVLVEDKNIPTCIPPGPMTITCIEYNESLPADISEATEEQLNAAFGSAVGIDNCEVMISSSVSGSVNSCGVGQLIRSFEAEDGEGFTDNDACMQSITIRGIFDYTITFPTDEESGCADIPAFDGLATEEFACDLITTDITIDTIAAVNAPEACFTLRVNYDVINYCEYNQLGECYRIPRDGDGIRNPETQLLYLNVIPNSTVNTEDDIAFLSRFTDRNYNAGAPQRDQLVDDGDDNDGTDDDNSNDSEDSQAANGIGFAYAQDDSRGFFCYIQYVDVYDEDAPTIEGDTPEECFAGSSADCTAEVTLTFTADDECTAPLVTGELDADYIASAGFIPTRNLTSEEVSNDGVNYTVNLSDIPVGNHAIRIRANDGCGNFDVEVIEFCVEGDKAPTPICISQLTVTLMPDGNGGGMAEIWASDFIASDVEDCFGNVIDKYSIYTELEAGEPGFEPQAGDLGLILTCDSDQTTPVRVYAIADNGAADYCSVFVLTQLFQEGLCTGGGSLAGTVLTRNEEAVEGVEVTLTGANDMDQVAMTAANGSYTFLNVPAETDYTIQPNHPVAVNLFNVTVGDVNLMGSVILGLTDFETPYDYLAADVDHDQDLTVGDMVSTQRVILGLDTDFGAAGNWGFVPVDVDVSSPYAEAFPGVYNINDLAGNVFDADFVALEYGNVNEAGRASSSIEVEDAQLEAGQTHVIQIAGADLLGFQGTLELAAGLEIIDVTYEGEGGLNLNDVADGVISMLFLADATVNVEVRATEAGLLSELVKMTSDVTIAEGINANGTAGPLSLAFVSSLAPIDYAQGPPATAPELLQNTPNPVMDVTTVRFRLLESGPATLTLRDAAGRMLRQQKIDAVAGMNRVELTDLQAGVITYTLTAGDFSATRKMVIVR